METALIRKLMARQDLTREESARLLGGLLREDREGWHFLSFSVASQTKGETVEEMLGMFDALRERTGPYPAPLPPVAMDVSSSGGSGIPKVNVSSLVALIVADDEVAVAKQSFWGITSVSGSADVLRAVGIEVPAVGVEELSAALAGEGLAFYSPLFVNRELENLVNFGRVLGEKRLGVNTPFNLVVPIFTPIPLRYRTFGINNPGQLGMVADVFRGLGFASALAFHGLDGLDEITLCAPTRMRGFLGEREVDLTLEPEQVGLATVPPEAIRPDGARGSVRDFLRIVRGVETGPKRDLVALNAAAAFWASGRAGGLEEGVEFAVRRLESGSVGAKLEALVERLGSPGVLREAEAEHLA